MVGYDVFARYYDALTANVDYKGRAAYLKKLLEHLHHEPGIVLDLACGTGSLTLELYKLGMDVYGVDGSIAMLSEAKDKAYDMEADVMFLCQKMQTLDLFGTVNTVFCSLDSINHLSGEAQVQAAFDRVAFFMDNDSWFIFDVNTLYKHEKVLGNNTYIYDLADIYCAWQNRYNPQDHSVAISLDFFEKEGIDTSRVKRCENGEKIGLTFTEIKSETESSIVMYRNDAADLKLEVSDIDEEYIKQGKALLISGTALCESPDRKSTRLNSSHT